MSTRAVVIGGSLAGLLAARVLSDQVDHVTVLDRDVWDDDTRRHRRGVPHAAHVHGLLGRGRVEMERLLPGLTDSLVDAGAQDADLLRDFRWHFGGVPLAAGTSGVRVLALSRPLLERIVRGMVLGLPNVRLHKDVAVRGLLHDADRQRMTGVVLEDRAGGTPFLHADVVVDASGRTSAVPAWLARLGYEPPREDAVPVDAAYTTRQFRRRPDQLDGRLGMAFAPAPGDRYTGLALAQEDGRWIVGLTGLFGHRVPRDLASFTSYAYRVHRVIGDLVADSEPVDHGVTFRFPASRWRRYDLVGRLPAGLYVIGDAMCSFNPRFGQGMSVAAMQARLLQDAVHHDLGDARRYFAATPAVLTVPWQVVVGSDFVELNGVEALPAAAQEMRHRVAAVQEAAQTDVAVATAFLRVLNLLEPPESLLSPAVAQRVAA